ERVRIYQLFVRLFGNTNETRKPNGTLAENGVGKFDDINVAALASLKDMGFTHLWLTGVLQQATATDYSSIGRPSDDADLLKGLAGSPYAIKDYFDVCPDYANDPAHRLDEFKALLGRIHAAGMKALIDLVPNHVARGYNSSVMPKSNFGATDDKTQFCDPRNNFYYLTPDSSGPPLRLPTVSNGVPVSPTCKVAGMQCDGFFEGEKTYGRVTGNNVASWTPGLNDWWETVKLNYGWDFIAHKAAHPTAEAPNAPIPNTWEKMDGIVEYWQSMGVDGFRCDMAHMVPVEFWKWMLAKARARKPDAYFIGEAYDNDPAKIPSGSGKSVLVDLLQAGFDAVYDDPSYKALKKIYDGPAWANDLDAACCDDLLFKSSLRYAENHDEVRLAASGQWSNAGMDVGRAVCGILYGLSRGPVMLYNGQEVGEPATGSAGFGGGNGRTTIFDYCSMPELAKWVNQHRYDGGGLSTQQKSLRDFYKKLLTLAGEPAFRDGDFFALNPANNGNPLYGHVEGEPAAGHWLYVFLRHVPMGGQRFLVVVNLHKEITFKNVRILFPVEALEAIGISSEPGKAGECRLQFVERIEGRMTLCEKPGEFAANRSLEIPEIPPLTPSYFEIVAG
ncbi:MAG: alpha-amylase family glycosyl hydrolase, partial [Chthoniobacteraceae bacterium]